MDNKKIDNKKTDNKYILVIEIRNEKKDFALCAKFIEEFQSDNYFFEYPLAFKLIKPLNKKMPPNKFEEPLTSEDISSSYEIIDIKKWKNNTTKYLKNISFHIRVHFKKNINYSNLHYLALLLKSFENLVENKRISIFLVPRTGDIYPFNKDGYTDIELFNSASTYLRAFIDNRNKGLIYAVRKEKDEENFTIVKALDFKTTSKVDKYFPIIVIDGNLQTNIDESERYLLCPKFGTVAKNGTHIKGEQLNHYYLFFKDGVAYDYLNLIIKTKKRERFGFAAHEKPSIALCDFIFETSYNTLINKLNSNNISVDVFLDLLPESFKTMNIFSFSIFCFIFDFQNQENNISIDIRSYCDLSRKISDGIEQIIQNSIQHSSRKVSIVSFYKDIKDNKLKIIVSDLSSKTILDTFAVNLEREDIFFDRDINENILSSLSSYKEEYKKTKIRISQEDLCLDFFFNDFKGAKNNKAVKEWFNFRQSDSSAHIGMSLFANAVQKCQGDFSIISSGDYEVKSKSKNYYSSNNNKKRKPIYTFPGTEYKINLSTEYSLDKFIPNITQLYNRNYSESYSSFAKFIDYQVEYVKYKQDRLTLNNNYIRIKNLTTNKALDKFALQLLWTDYWLNVLEHLNLVTKKVHCIDYKKIEISENFLKHNYAKETVIKGLVDALGIFSTANHGIEIYIAIINANIPFLKLFEEITPVLSLKSFPKNLQFFISDYTEMYQIHLLGNNYGVAIQNAYLLSYENYYKSYDGLTYHNINNIIQPFYKLIQKTSSQKSLDVLPFTGILQSQIHEKSMFLSKIDTIANKDIINEDGYKFSESHTKLGNKVHIHSFYEMSHLFYRTVMANNVAFYIIRDLIQKNYDKENSKIDLLNDKIIFYGYASYSQAILMSVVKILESYRHQNNAKTGKVSYSIYQYNLQYESNPRDIKIYFSNKNILNSKSQTKIIQVVPISSTLTTFAKMWKKMISSVDFPSNISLTQNYTVFWVRDLLESPRAKNEKGENLNISVLEYKYFNIDANKNVTTHFSALDNKTINYLLIGNAKWELPESCSKCYPDNYFNEVPIIETDPTSTVPSQQIYPNLFSLRSKNELKSLTKDEADKLSNLYGHINYGHYKRGKNHYQYFIDTQSYFASVSNKVKIWLEKLRKKECKKENTPIINIIFSPAHNTNVGFSQYVNAYYFNGSAEIISINEDKEFTSNFNCEYAMIKNTIQQLVDDHMDSYMIYKQQSNIKKSNFKPVRFVFVDDNIITGGTFRKASKLLQSLLPENIVDIYGTNVFEECFVLIDRMSTSTKRSYILPEENFHSFCKINISSLRIHGDSCVCCKLKHQAERLYKRSSTQFAAEYWFNKMLAYEEKSFETINAHSNKKGNNDKNYSYLRALYSHIIKNLLSNTYNNTNEIFNVLLTLFDFFSHKEKNILYNKPIVCYLESFLPILKKPLKNNNKVNFNQESIKNIIKVLSRPFFTYNHNIRQEVLKFLIILSETIISNEIECDKVSGMEQKAFKVAKNIVDLFKGKEKFDFLKDVVFDALADLHSTYLLRIGTINKVLYFVDNNVKEKLVNNITVQEFFLFYSICIQKIVDDGFDETRSLRLEYFLISGNDSFDEEYKNNNYDKSSATFYQKIVNKYHSNELESVVQQAFEYFCNEVFLCNGRILYDAIERKFIEDGYSYEKNTSVNNNALISTNSSDNYFMERWEKFRSLDNSWLNLKKKEHKIDKELALYKLLYEQNIPTDSNDSDIIEIRYKNLLTKIKEMIVEKYNINEKDMHIALLTCSSDNNNNIRDLELIESSLEYRSDQYATTERMLELNSNTRYIIKKRISAVLDQDQLNNLGYYVVDSLDETNYDSTDEIDINDDYETIEENNYRKPYFILKFSNDYYDYYIKNYKYTSNMIVPVYLYLSIIVDSNDNSERIILPRLIMRDILTFRKKIMNYLEVDFKNDVMKRYALSVDTEAILKNEKVMSHTPMDQDKQELKDLLSENAYYIGKSVDINKIKNWAIARNYCNTMIARLYNRVLRNINKPFDKIVNEYERINRETYKLYIDKNDKDGKNFPLLNIQDVLPISPYIKQKGEIYNLFNEVINFTVNDIPENMQAYTFKYKSNKKVSYYTYNIDYVKSIIYRICFDAMRFSRGSHAEYNNFIARVANHYQTKNMLETYNELNNPLLKIKDKKNICNIFFSVEESNSSYFDWLIIKNEIDKTEKSNIGFLKKKLEDPLDFTDGHMSLITAKEYFSKLLPESEHIYLNEMYDYLEENDSRFFVTKLPIINKGDLRDEKTRNFMDR